MLRNLHLVLTSALVLMVLHDNALSDHILLLIFLVHFDFLHHYSFFFIFYLSQCFVSFQESYVLGAMELLMR